MSHTHNTHRPSHVECSLVTRVTAGITFLVVAGVFVFMALIWLGCDWYVIYSRKKNTDRQTGPLNIEMASSDGKVIAAADKGEEVQVV